MKSKIVKVKSFYNNLTHHLPAITEFYMIYGFFCYVKKNLSCSSNIFITHDFRHVKFLQRDGQKSINNDHKYTKN